MSRQFLWLLYFKMGKITLEMLAKSPSHTKKRRDETVQQYVRRLTHLHFSEKNIDEIVSSCETSSIKFRLAYMANSSKSRCLYTMQIFNSLVIIFDIARYTMSDVSPSLLKAQWAYIATSHVVFHQNHGQYRPAVERIYTTLQCKLSKLSISSMDWRNVYTAGKISLKLILLLNFRIVFILSCTKWKIFTVFNF